MNVTHSQSVNLSMNSHNARKHTSYTHIYICIYSNTLSQRCTHTSHGTAAEAVGVIDTGTVVSGDIGAAHVTRL